MIRRSRLVLTASAFVAITLQATLAVAAPPVVAPPVVRSKTRSADPAPAAGGLSVTATTTTAPAVDDGRECIPARYGDVGMMTINVRDRRTGTPPPTRCFYEIAKHNFEVAKKTGKPWRGSELSMRYYRTKWLGEQLAAAAGAQRTKLEKDLNLAIDAYERAATAGAKELNAKIEKSIADAQAQAAELKRQYEAATGKLKEELHAKQVAAERMAKSLERELAKLDLGYAQQRFEVAQKRVGAKAEELKRKAQERLDQAKKTYDDARARLDAAIAKLEGELENLRKKLDAAIEQVEGAIEGVEGAVDDATKALDGLLG